VSVSRSPWLPIYTSTRCPRVRWPNGVHEAACTRGPTMQQLKRVLLAHKVGHMDEREGRVNSVLHGFPLTSTHRVTLSHWPPADGNATTLVLKTCTVRKPRAIAPMHLLRSDWLACKRSRADQRWRRRNVSRQHRSVARTPAQAAARLWEKDQLVDLSLAAEVCFEQGLSESLVSIETIRQSLLRLGVRWQRTKRGITSPDPDYVKKKNGATPSWPWPGTTDGLLATRMRYGAVA
jgi:hypothetical protein